MSDIGSASIFCGAKPKSCSCVCTVSGHNDSMESQIPCTAFQSAPVNTPSVLPYCAAKGLSAGFPSLSLKSRPATSSPSNTATVSISRSLNPETRRSMFERFPSWSAMPNTRSKDQLRPISRIFSGTSKAVPSRRFRLPSFSPYFLLRLAILVVICSICGASSLLRPRQRTFFWLSPSSKG